jgi:MFS family permease
MKSFRQKREIALRVRLHSDQDKDVLPPKSDKYFEAGINIIKGNWDDYDEDLDPKNWHVLQKLAATLFVTAIAFVTQYASAVDSAAAGKIQKELNVGILAESWATGIYLLGFAVGSPFAGPLSEINGRNPVYITILLLFSLSTIGAGMASNLSMQLAFRFLMGFFGSAPLVCAGGTVNDLWIPKEQIRTFPLYATGAFLGIPVATIVGGQIGQADHLSWRWVEWTTLILSGFVLLLVVLFLPETHGNTLLHWKATIQTSIMSSKGLTIESPSPKEEASIKLMGTRIFIAFYGPISMSITEPIILMLSLYLSACYIVIFSLLPGYTFIFSDIYKFGPAKRGLAYLGLGVGFLLAYALSIPVSILSNRIIRQKGSLPPEARLYYAIVGAPCVPISLFWMAWTSKSSIPSWSAITSTVPLGFGILCIFFSCYHYIIDVYSRNAASGLVFVSLMRYLAAGAMIEIAIPMYTNIGVTYSLTILGVIGTILAPIPLILYHYGPVIRARSKMTI